MLRRSALFALVPSILLACAGLEGCAYTGKQQVRVETGNQPAGFISRPMLLTTATDESVRSVAQDICDNVRPGSTAKINFVGKVPAPDPVSLGDWGRYRYVCELSAPVVMTAPHTSTPVPPPAAAAAAPVAVAAAAAAAGPVTAGPVTAGPAAASAPLAPAAAVAMPASNAPAAQLRQTADTRACVLQKGNYHLCLANCMINSTSAAEAVESECLQRCAGKVAASCN